MPAIEILLEEMYEPKYHRGHSNGLLVHLISNGTFCFFALCCKSINTNDNL